MAKMVPLDHKEWEKFERILVKRIQDSTYAVERGAENWGRYVASVARKKAPVDTGNLRRSIGARSERSPTARLEVTILVGTNVKYAVFQEFGTGIYAQGGRGRQRPWIFVLKAPTVGQRKVFAGRMHYSARYGGWVVWTRGSRPHPFLRPAFDENLWRLPYFIRAEFDKKGWARGGAT